MFFYLSKILWFFADPGNILLIALCISAVLAWSRWKKTAKILLSLTALYALVLTTVPIGRQIVLNLENRFPPVSGKLERVGGIVVLGGVVDQFITQARGQVAINSAAERLTEFAKLAFKYPDAKLVFTGGSGVLGRQELKEAHFIKPVLVTLGINPNRVIFEDQSKNTVENAVFTKQLIKPLLDEKWVLITSAFHMPRAAGSFRQAGWTIIPYPVDFTTKGNEAFAPGFSLRSGLNSFAHGLHEWIGLTFYWLTGRTNEFYPGPD